MSKMLSGVLSDMGEIWRFRSLLLSLVVRDVVGRYRGSALGIAWSFVNPLLMLIIYTFVFSVVFKAKWGIGEGGSHSSFAIVLFAGLIQHSLLSESLVRSGDMIRSNVAFVKKLVFPLQMLPLVGVLSALFHALISLAILVVANLILNGKASPTLLLYPVVVAPLLMGTAGVSWVMSAVAVYVPDVKHVVGMLMTILLFTSPIFFPIGAVPEKFRTIMSWNPLTKVVENVRAVVIQGDVPDWGGVGLGAMIATGIFVFGLAIFKQLRGGFADVL